jgi:hypothetical protein
VIAMTYRYDWRVTSYALFLREDYPPFDFQPAADDDGADAHTVVTLTYPDELNRWKPLYKWFLAIPHYVVLFGLWVAAVFVIIAGDPPDLMQVDEQERQHQPGSDHGHGIAGEEQASRTGQPGDLAHWIRSWCNWVPIKGAN